MTFFDTNVLVYGIVTQDETKQKRACGLIEQALHAGRFAISPLVLSELIYVLTRLGADKELIFRNVELYKAFISHAISVDIIWEAFTIAHVHNAAGNINDLIHIKYAERYCTEIITFDKGFESFKRFTQLSIKTL